MSALKRGHFQWWVRSCISLFSLSSGFFYDLFPPFPIFDFPFTPFSSSRWCYVFHLSCSRNLTRAHIMRAMGDFTRKPCHIYVLGPSHWFLSLAISSDDILDIYSHLILLLTLRVVFFHYWNWDSDSQLIKVCRQTLFLPL